MNEENNVFVGKRGYIDKRNGSVSEKINENYALDEISKLVSTSEPVTPMQEINKVYEVCKFGRFHVKLLLFGFFGAMASLLVTNSASYLLPIAECDLNMNLKQKGLLNAMPYFGMFASSLITGFLTDTFGRIIFLRIGFGGIFLCTLFSATSQNYEMLVAAKLCEGVLFATSIAAITSLASEFCHTSVRDRVMICQSSFSAVGQIICPVMAWGLLIQDWKYCFFDGRFVLNTWNFYLLAMSLWSLVAFVLYLTLPESPKFLVTQKRYVEAKNILIKVYTENSRKPADTFPFPNLFEKVIKEEKENSEITEKETKTGFGERIIIGLKNMKPLLGRPLLGILALIGTMQFITLGIHNVVKLWFPQLSTIVENYKLDGNQNLCELLDSYTGSLERKSISNSTSNICIPHVTGTETYINSIIIGLICLLPFFISGVFVNKVGKKVLLIAGAIICTASLLGLRWANSKTSIVAFFSINIAITHTMRSLNQVVLLDVIPTNMRTLALALSMNMARIGTLVSNIAFPILLAMGCSIPFYTMAAMMSCLVALSLFLPKKKL